MSKKNSSEKLIDKLCMLCGVTENLTLHHLHSQKREIKEANKLGIINHSGECIPLCRDCHNKIEFLQHQKNFLKKINKHIKELKTIITILSHNQFNYLNEKNKKT